MTKKSISCVNSSTWETLTLLFDERELRLVILEWEGDQELWSMTYRKMLAMAVDGGLEGGWCDSLDPINIDELEGKINEYNGRKAGGDPPSHQEVLDYLDAHELVPQEGLGRRYADIGWHVGDLTGMTKMNDEEAEEWLLNNQSKIRDRLCELGHEVIECFLQMDGIDIDYGDNDD
jgi:hypothetical protein